MPTQLTKSEEQILYAYGVSLVTSGFKPYIATWQDLVYLVDDKEQELFSDYFSETTFKDVFAERFLAARIEAVTQAGWNDEKLNRKLFRTDPQHGQSIGDYYHKFFAKAIKGERA